MKIRNGYIKSIVEFLDKLNLKGRDSLGRTKLKEKLNKQSEVLSKDQTEIIEEYDGWTDKEKGQFTTQNEELNQAMNDLLTDEVEITYNSPFRKDFTTALENYDGELSGLDADVYALLYEKLIEEKEEENE